jgi:hypothetical protein
MKLPRFTVRNRMPITAMIAVGLFVAQEFWEGMPRDQSSKASRLGSPGSSPG